MPRRQSLFIFSWFALILFSLFPRALAGGGKQAVGRALQLQDYFRIESADSPAISPDGRWVAFVRSFIIEAENRRHSEIWLAPFEQAEQMYTALKKRRVPARFVRYTDSYHGGWSSWNTVHRYHQEMKWWEQYLGDKQSAAR